jgi:hypothetical protein
MTQLMHKCLPRWSLRSQLVVVAAVPLVVWGCWLVYQEYSYSVRTKQMREVFSHSLQEYETMQNRAMGLLCVDMLERTVVASPELRPNDKRKMQDRLSEARVRLRAGILSDERRAREEQCEPRTHSARGMSP